MIIIPEDTSMENYEESSVWTLKSMKHAREQVKKLYGVTSDRWINSDII